MRTKRQIIYLYVSQLSEEEYQALIDMGLDCCDNCGKVDESEKLHWIDSKDFTENENCVSLVVSGMNNLCTHCYDKKENKIAQCGSCDKYFIAHKDANKWEEHKTDCPHCGSGNWAYGCIDEEVK